MTNNSRYSERSPDFQVETYAAVRLYLDSWRWTGVPFLIRAEKCLRNRCDGSVCKAEGIAGRRFSYMSGSCAGPYQADKSRSHRPARSQALTSMPSGYAKQPGVSTLLCKRPRLVFGDGCAREGGNFPFPRSAILEKVCGS